MPSMSTTSSERAARRLAPVALLAGVLGVALLTCCGPDGGELDGGAPDGGVARDAGRDGSHDASRPRDAGRDAGPPPPPVWLPLEGLPEGCELSLAADPEAVAGPLRFEECPDMAGCRQLVVDWTTEQAPRLNIVTGSHDGEHGYFAYARGAEPGWRWVVVARDDGHVLAVVRSRIEGTTDGFQCYAFNVAPTSEHAGFVVATSRPGVIGDSIIGLIEWGSGTPTFRVLATLTTAFLGPNNFPQQIEIGDDFIAAQVVPRYDVVRVGFDGSVRFVTGAEPGGPVLEAGGRDGLFYLTLRPASGLWTATADDEVGRVLWDPPDADIGGIETDGVDLVWAQMYDKVREYEYGRVELWTSPYTTDPAALAPRRVAEVPIGFLAATLHAGSGHALVAAAGVLTVYALDTGRIGLLRPPPDTEWRGHYVAFFGPEELAVMPSRLRSFVPESSTLRIIRYDALLAE